MPSLTVGVFSDDLSKRASVCGQLAKKSSEDDIGFYHTSWSGVAIAVLDPVRYPEKVQSLLYVAFLSDYCVLAVDALNPVIGEIIVALDLLQKKSGCILTSLQPEQLQPFLKGTALENYPIYSEVQAVREAAFSHSPTRETGPLKAIVDHSFEVKGVGSVALGLICRGTLKVHDKLTVYPSQKQIEVRSIQMNDVDCQAASAGDRFGIGFKGLAAKELSRGDVLAQEGKAVSNLEAEAEASKFSKGLRDGEVLHAAVGLQFVPCKLAGAIAAGGRGPAKLTFESPIALDSSDTIVLVRLNEKTLRIAGRVVAR